MPAKLKTKSSSKVSLGAKKFTPNPAQRKANEPWLTLLCFIAEAFHSSGRQPRTKTSPQLHSVRLARSRARQMQALPTSSDPSVLRGMQLTCGLPDLMMSVHHQNGGNSSMTGRRIPPSFVNNRRVWQSRIEYAWACNFTLQVVLGLQRTSKSYFARQTTFWLDFKPLTLQS